MKCCNKMVKLLQYFFCAGKEYAKKDKKNKTDGKFMPDEAVILTVRS